MDADSTVFTSLSTYRGQQESNIRWIIVQLLFRLLGPCDGVIVDTLYSTELCPDLGVEPRHRDQNSCCRVMPRYARLIAILHESNQQELGRLLTACTYR